jgi:hypothetical protein
VRLSKSKIIFLKKFSKNSCKTAKEVLRIRGKIKGENNMLEWLEKLRLCIF